MKINLKINETNRQVEISADETLYEVLRRCGINSVKKSCDTTSCGVCTILLDEKPVASCSYLAAKADGHSITTIEGVQTEADRIGKLMNDEGAVQCGFCTTGFILTVIAMNKELENPNEDEIKNYLIGNLCRCSGYEGQMRAVKKYVEVSR